MELQGEDGNRALPEGVREPYDWAVDQMRVDEAHVVTQGSEDVIVAVIDLGYRFHPDHDGHLWRNPNPTRGDLHGWDCAEDDASLEYEGIQAHQTYQRGHHAFIVGEVARVAPKCPIMIVRVGYEPHHKESWRKAIEYAVGHGARVLIIPHGYISLDPSTGVPLFYQGTDFTYPLDNKPLRTALEQAYDAGCLIFSGTADNRGRRVAYSMAALESVVAVGSTDKDGRQSNVAASAEYVEMAAPAGDRGTNDSSRSIWGTGGDGDYIPFEGGCMAAGFAGAVAALIFSRYPKLSNEHVRQIMRNTARGDGWNEFLGWGILDAGRAVSLTHEQLKYGMRICTEKSLISDSEKGRSYRRVDVVVENVSAFDIDKSLLVLYNGDPLTPANTAATRSNPVGLVRKQIGHLIKPIRGLQVATFSIDVDCHLIDVGQNLYAQVYALDRGAGAAVDTAHLRL